MACDDAGRCSPPFQPLLGAVLEIAQSHNQIYDRIHDWQGYLEIGIALS
jgi:hypothetical protein